VVVEPALEPDRAAEVAGLLAAHQDGTVAILPSLAQNRTLRRAIAASRRIVLQTTGAWPPVLGEEMIREAAIAAAVREADASLLVLSLGSTRRTRSAAITVARQVSCPVLTVPSLPHGGGPPPHPS
jgi:nucleotide-binding universal stress UspA family protein